MINRRAWFRRTALFTGATLAALRGRANAQTAADPHAGHAGMPGMKMPVPPATVPSKNPHAGRVKMAAAPLHRGPSSSPGTDAATRAEMLRLRRELGYTPVTTPNGRTLPWRMKNGG